MEPKLDYSYTHKLSEEEYVDLNSIFSFKIRRYLVPIYAVVGIACLLSQYTFILGIVILTLSIIATFHPKIIRYGAALQYRDITYLHHELRYHVGDSKLSIDGVNDFHASCNWQNDLYWNHRRGWIIIGTSGMPQIYIPESKAKDDGVYDAIVYYASKYARHVDKGRRKHVT